MNTKLCSPVLYQLRIGEDVIELNDYLHKKVEFKFTGNIFCIQCGRKTKKSFQQGFCFPCLQRLQECNLCMIHPERCTVEHGTCPKDDWAHSQCYAESIVYLANSSAIKVGITRCTNIPSRWIDQGATQALPIYKVQNRHQVGLIEVALKEHVADKTNWRVMLKGSADSIDLVAERDRIIDAAEDALTAIYDEYEDGEIEFLDEEPVEINYPVNVYPEKIKSLSLDKTPIVTGVLQGIKGQYIYLDSGVMNIRKFGGYEVEFQ